MSKRSHDDVEPEAPTAAPLAKKPRLDADAVWLFHASQEEKTIFLVFRPASTPKASLIKECFNNASEVGVAYESLCWIRMIAVDEESKKDEEPKTLAEELELALTDLSKEELGDWTDIDPYIPACHEL